MNYLKEMGIQQWQRRLAHVVAVSDDERLSPHVIDEINPTLADVANGQSLVNAGDVVNDRVELPAETQNDLSGDDSSGGGFSGSLRQALGQSTPKKKENKSMGLQSMKSNNVGSERQTSKLATPINLSTLLMPGPELEQREVHSEIGEVSDESSAQENELVTNLDSPLEGPAHTLAGQDLSKMDEPNLRSLIETNEHCPSCGWGNSLFATGNQHADWLFIIDAPNSGEIKEQTLFSGRVGQLFDAMLRALNLSRSAVYCTSIFKCAPTDDLSLTPQCDDLVHQQIQLVSPKVVIAFGEFASQSVIKSDSALTTLRGTEQYCFRSQVVVVPTYSPAEMLDDVSLKAHVWADLKQAMSVASV